MSNYPQGVMLPNDEERKQIFYWLKRISSYTAWNRILSYYQAWAKITEKSVQAASERGWLRTADPKTGHYVSGVRTGRRIYDGCTGVQYDEYTGTAIGQRSLVDILKCLAHCDEGVRRLCKGDKRVFQYNAHGEFVMASRMLLAWLRTQTRIEWHETGIDEKHTPYWKEFDFALTQLGDAWGECSPFIIEPEDLNATSLVLFNPTMRDMLGSMSFPQAPPEIPSLEKHTLIATGRTIPYSGIWEPVEVPKPKGLHLFGASRPQDGSLHVSGTMNYLHGGSRAPQTELIKDAKYAATSTTWRLLWRDDRYEDGTIPEEESGYVFQKPDPMQVAPESEELRGGMRIWSDEPCPYPGVWQCLDKPLGPQTIAFGVPMPRVQGEKVVWRLIKAV